VLRTGDAGASAMPTSYVSRPGGER
jgi:hypothetical protein